MYISSPYSSFRHGPFQCRVWIEKWLRATAIRRPNPSKLIVHVRLGLLRIRLPNKSRSISSEARAPEVHLYMGCRRAFGILESGKSGYAMTISSWSKYSNLEHYEEQIRKDNGHDCTLAQSTFPAPNQML